MNLFRKATGTSTAAVEQSPSKVQPLRVLVTGAGGRTGRIIVRKLLERGAGDGGEFGLVRALVRSEESKAQLVDSLGQLKGVDICIGNIGEPETLTPVFNGIDAVIIATSAKPQPIFASLAYTIALRLGTFGMVSARPFFCFPENETPEHVDWMGQSNQFDAVKASGVKHVVLISSMAGTKTDHFLNTNMGQICLWKRKAECALVKSGCPYTILHPGGLLPHPPLYEPVPGGKRELKVGVDDTMLDNVKETLIPREDLAEVCVRCVQEGDVVKSRSFDLCSRPEGQGTPFDGNMQKLLEPLGGANCSYTEADSTFCALERPSSRGCNCV